jgi:cytochrome c biogenesis protein CcmG/thiol:disulfide interchange protein DsbE
MAAVALLLLVTACGGDPGTEATPTPVPTLPGSPTELPDADPGTFRQLLSTLRGTPVLVNVWASWCGPCFQEAPALADMAREFTGKVQFLGLDILDRRAPARQFISQFGWTYPSLFDPPGAIRDDLGLIGQPHTIIYDATGRQVFVWSGAVNEPLLRQELEKVSS